MVKKFLLILALVLIPTISQAAWTEFSDNTVAVAGEVNGNFDFRTDDVDPLNGAGTETDSAQTLGTTSFGWRALYLDNTPTSGGTVYFDGSDQTYMESSADGLTLNFYISGEKRFFIDPTRFAMVVTFNAQGIQDAIDNLDATGGEVYLPTATYNMTVTANANTTAKVVIDKANVTLRGAGNASIISGVGAGGTHMFDIQAENVTIKDLYFYASDTLGGGLNDGKFAIRNTVVAERISIFNCNFRGWERGISIENINSLFCKIYDCRMENITITSPNYGVFFDDNDYSSIQNCYFENVSGAAIHLQDTNFNIVQNNTIFADTSGSRGINIVGTDDSNIFGNVIQNMGGALSIQIEDSASSGNIVAGNIMNVTSGGGINLIDNGKGTTTGLNTGV